MRKEVLETSDTRKFRLSLDTWAVIVALVAAVLIRAGVIPRVPW